MTGFVGFVLLAIGLGLVDWKGVREELRLVLAERARNRRRYREYQRLAASWKADRPPK